MKDKIKKEKKEKKIKSPKMKLGKNKEVIIPEIKDTKDVGVIEKGTRTLKDFIAPASFDRTDEYHLRVGPKFVRSFVMKGYPSNASVGWLQNLFEHEGDLDTAIYVEPADERAALDELTAKITQFEAQLDIEMKKGMIRNNTKLHRTISNLYAQRANLEQNNDSMFHVSIHANLYTDTKEDLNKQHQVLNQKTKGKRIELLPNYLRQDDGYKSALPFGKNYVTDMYRNFNSGALTACFPFYNSEISHKNGVLCGTNISTNTPVYIDFFDRQVLNNSNISIIGASGSGKTFFVSLLIMRSALKGVKTVIIDPEGDYKLLTNALGGSHIYLHPNSDVYINPFDIEEEVGKNGESVVNIKEKVSDVLNLIAVMAHGLTPEQKSMVSHILMKVYEEKGFTEDPESLYVKEAIFNEDTKEFYHHGIKKPMPVFSDFHRKLEETAMSENSEQLKALANSLLLYKKGGIYDMFDNETSPHLRNFKDSPIVTFDVSGLEEGMLRPIGMYIALSWTWEKFAKKDLNIRKSVVCDEGWMLVNKNMAGHEYTTNFVDQASRRIRKRNGSLIIASQSFNEFAQNPTAKSVLTNSAVNILLKQSSTDVDLVQETFKLSDGEKGFLASARQGEMLIMMNGESAIAKVNAFPYEKNFISNPLKPKN